MIAFKALRRDFVRDLDTIQSEIRQSGRTQVDAIVQHLRQACEDAGATDEADESFVTEEAIISLADAKSQVGLLDRLGHELKVRSVAGCCQYPTVHQCEAPADASALALEHDLAIEQTQHGIITARYRCMLQMFFLKTASPFCRCRCLFRPRDLGARSCVMSTLELEQGARPLFCSGQPARLKTPPIYTVPLPSRTMHL